MLTKELDQDIEDLKAELKLSKERLQLWVDRYCYFTPKDDRKVEWLKMTDIVCSRTYAMYMRDNNLSIPDNYIGKTVGELLDYYSNKGHMNMRWVYVLRLPK